MQKNTKIQSQRSITALGISYETPCIHSIDIAGDYWHIQVNSTLKLKSYFDNALAPLNK
jgi:hypothetical protein